MVLDKSLYKLIDWERRSKLTKSGMKRITTDTWGKPENHKFILLTSALHQIGKQVNNFLDITFLVPLPWLNQDQMNNWNIPIWPSEIKKSLKVSKEPKRKAKKRKRTGPEGF